VSSNCVILGHCIMCCCRCTLKFLRNMLPPSLSLRMETAYSWETLLYTFKTTQCSNSDDRSNFSVLFVPGYWRRQAINRISDLLLTYKFHWHFHIFIYVTLLFNFQFHIRWRPMSAPCSQGAGWMSWKNVVSCVCSVLKCSVLHCSGLWL
jgi:hypothetical protein